MQLEERRRGDSRISGGGQMAQRGMKIRRKWRFASGVKPSSPTLCHQQHMNIPLEVQPQPKKTLQELAMPKIEGCSEQMEPSAQLFNTNTSEGRANGRDSCPDCACKIFAAESCHLRRKQAQKKIAKMAIANWRRTEQESERDRALPAESHRRMLQQVGAWLRERADERRHSATFGKQYQGLVFSSSHMQARALSTTAPTTTGDMAYAAERKQLAIPIASPLFMLNAERSLEKRAIAAMRQGFDQNDGAE
jgi:hypothetical protein